MPAPTFSAHTFAVGDRVAHYSDPFMVGTVTQAVASLITIRFDDSRYPTRPFEARYYVPSTMVERFGDEDGCSISAAVDTDQPHPIVTIDVEAKWDASIVVDLTPDQARAFAAQLIAAADEA